MPPHPSDPIRGQEPWQDPPTHTLSPPSSLGVPLPHPFPRPGPGLSLQGGPGQTWGLWNKQATNVSRQGRQLEPSTRWTCVRKERMGTCQKWPVFVVLIRSYQAWLFSSTLTPTEPILLVMLLFYKSGIVVDASPRWVVDWWSFILCTERFAVSLLSGGG